MTLQTGNALLLIRCFTKYMIEIENETALLEQLQIKSPRTDTGSLSDSLNGQPQQNQKNTTTVSEAVSSSSSNNASPKRHRTATNASSGASGDKNRYNYRSDNNDSLEDSAADSDPDLTLHSGEENIMLQLVRHLFELCIEAPVE
jgi:hypothetical protein